jgi:hypothetical protein
MAAPLVAVGRMIEHAGSSRSRVEIGEGYLPLLLNCTHGIVELSFTKL